MRTRPITVTITRLPEVTDDGRAARLVPAGDPDQLAHAISDLVQRPEEAEALGRQGREFVVRAFSWSRAAAHYERIYSELSNTEGREGPPHWTSR